MFNQGRMSVKAVRFSPSLTLLERKAAFSEKQGFTLTGLYLVNYIHLLLESVHLLLKLVTHCFHVRLYALTRGVSKRLGNLTAYLTSLTCMYYIFIAQIDEGPSLSAYMQTECHPNRFITRTQAPASISVHWVRYVHSTPLFSVPEGSLAAEQLTFFPVCHVAERKQL